MNNGVGSEKPIVSGNGSEGIRVTKVTESMDKKFAGWALWKQMTGWLLKGKIFTRDQVL